MEYLVVLEKEKRNYGAFVPDLPGCVADAESKPRVRKLIEEAISLRSRGQRIPRPRTSYELVSAH
jgi:predicted RNase H-like HicB family nuclease